MQYLYELLSQHLNEINNPQRDEVDELMTILAGCGFQPLRLGTKLTNQQITGIEEVNTVLRPCRTQMNKALFAQKKKNPKKHCRNLL